MSTADQPPPKRRRTEDSLEDPSDRPADPVRSDIWYDDGNVILQAENTQYKVYRGVLAQSSSVFRDMFSFPQPPASNMVTIEGCPVIRLSDSAEEVKYILQAIFEQKYMVPGHLLCLQLSF